VKKQRAVRVPVAYTTYRLKTQKKMGPLGRVDYGKKTISVNKTMQDYGQWSTSFWHEWFHAVFHENGYISVSENEALIESSAQALMRMFTDPQGRLLLKGMLKHVAPK